MHYYSHIYIPAQQQMLNSSFNCDLTLLFVIQRLYERTEFEQVLAKRNAFSFHAFETLLKAGSKHKQTKHLPGRCIFLLILLYLRHDLSLSFLIKLPFVLLLSPHLALVASIGDIQVFDVGSKTDSSPQ